MNSQLIRAALSSLALSSLAFSQVMIPDGTRIRLRLEQTLSSETAENGQIVDFSVTQEVRVGDAIVIANGARATGTVSLVEAKKRLGRAGKLDFSIDRVQTVDGSWLNLRYVPNKARGQNQVAKTAILSGTLGIAFGGVGALGLLTKGKDVVINKGRTFDVFSDESAYVSNAVAASTPNMARPLPQAPASMVRMANGTPVMNGGLPPQVAMAQNPYAVSNVSMMGQGEMGGPQQPAQFASAGGAMVTVNSNVASADIEIDGAFVGNAPATVQLTPGVHTVVVRNGGQVWQRQVQITGGTITLNAQLTPAVRR